MADIKPGDTVRLKSGGPLMTVHSITSEGEAWCEWFDKAGKDQSRSFVKTSLVADDGAPVIV